MFFRGGQAPLAPCHRPLRWNLVPGAVSARAEPRLTRSGSRVPRSPMAPLASARVSCCQAERAAAWARCQGRREPPVIL